MTETSHATNPQSFDIDLKVLKSRPVSKASETINSNEKQLKPVTATKTAKIKKQKNRKLTKKTTGNILKQQAPARQYNEDQHKILLLKRLPSPDSVPVQTSGSTLILKHSADSCDLIQQVLKTGLASQLAQSELLATLPQITYQAVQGRKAKTVITCGLSSKEEFTYGRLLSIHDIKILNVNRDDSPEKVVNKLTSSLGYATQSFRTGINSKKVIYVFPENSGNGIFISIP